MNWQNLWRRLTSHGNRYTVTVTDTQLCITLSPTSLARRALQSLRTARHVTLEVAPGRIRLSTKGAKHDIQLEIPLCVCIEVAGGELECAIRSEDGEEVRRPVHTLRFFTHGLPREVDTPPARPAPTQMHNDNNQKLQP